jgi:uncharacterized membrane protein HdeD (DUF308 family)
MRAVRTPVLERMVTRLPPWALAAVAVLCGAAGVVLTLSPFTSAEVLVLLVGLNALATGVLLVARDEAASGYRELLGVGWLILGVVILARPGLAVVALAVVIGVALVVTGVVDVAGALTGRQTERAAAFIGGLAAIIFGVLALSWTDVTIFVVAVLFGARTVLFGLSLLRDLTRPWWGPKSETETALPGWLRAGWRLASRVVALVLALLLVAVSAMLHRGAPSPVPAFYDWFGAVPTTPGELLRNEPMTGSIPSNAQGWRILDSTKDSTKTSLGKPAISSGFVLAPKELPAGPRPVILWTHGTEGIARTCAPSLFPDVTAAIPAVAGRLRSRLGADGA